MKVIKAAVPVAMLVVALGCDDKKPKATAASAAPSVAAAPEPVKVAEAPRPAPADIVLDPLFKDLKCERANDGSKDKNKKKTAAAKTESCRVLGEFADASRWSAQTPAGEGRWIGQAFVREKGVETKQLLLLWAKTVPTSQVGPGDLPVRVGTGTLDSELIEHGFKMVAALHRGDQPSRRNQAQKSVESFVPSTNRGAVNTAGASVRLISEETVYLRQAGRKVLLVAPSQAQSAAPGDGTYAEFWRATW